MRRQHSGLPPQPIGCHPTTCRCIAPFARLPPAPAPTQRCLTLPPPTAQRYLTLSPHPSTNLPMPHHGLLNRRQPHNDTTANPKPDQPCQFTDTPYATPDTPGHHILTLQPNHPSSFFAPTQGRKTVHTVFCHLSASLEPPQDNPENRVNLARGKTSAFVPARQQR